MKKHEIRGILRFPQDYKIKGCDERCCCDLPRYPDCNIGEQSLYRFISSLLPCYEENIEILRDDEYDPDYKVLTDSISAGYRFYILENIDHQDKVRISDLDNEQSIKCLGGDLEWASACYSAATCGLGDWNVGVFGGHNIFDELSIYNGKYAIIEFEIDSKINI